MGSNRWVLLLCLLLPGVARGDGGTVRLSERVGAYQVTVFTSPTPFRAGPVDVSVLVQDAANGRPIPDARVVVHVAPADRPEQRTGYPATEVAATNKLFRAAKFDLPAAGWWQVEVEVDGREQRCRFQVEAAEPLPRWVELWPWIALPALPVLLFAIHQLLAKRAALAGRLPRAL